MNNLLEKNIYNLKGKVLVCGTCLPNMQKEWFEKNKNNYDSIVFLCLEKDHINMAITKICGVLSTGNVESLTFASVNKSPHCTGMHSITKEIKRVMDNTILPEVKNIVIQDNEVYEIDEEVLSLSKDLVRLSFLLK